MARGDYSQTLADLAHILSHAPDEALAARLRQHLVEKFGL